MSAQLPYSLASTYSDNSADLGRDNRFLMYLATTAKVLEPRTVGLVERLGSRSLRVVVSQVAVACRERRPPADSDGHPPTTV